MLRLLLRSSLLLSLLLALPISLIRPRPYDDRILENLLLPPADCRAPCFMGLRPGETTMEEVGLILEAHPWVDNFVLQLLEGSRGRQASQWWIIWDWSGQEPESIDPAYPGRVDFTALLGSDDYVVSNINIHTRLRMAQLQNWFGQADEGNVTRRDEDALSYELIYRSTRLGAASELSTLLPCPAHLLDYWHSQAQLDITIRVGLVSNLYISPTEALKVC